MPLLFSEPLMLRVGSPGVLHCFAFLSGTPRLPLACGWLCPLQALASFRCEGISSCLRRIKGLDPSASNHLPILAL